jgi:hypothetical protein
MERNWITEEETFEWLSDDNLPQRNVQHMLQYIRVKWPEAFEKLVHIDGKIPQSFAHWWAHSRAADPEAFQYEFIEYWRPVAYAWQGTDASLTPPQSPRGRTKTNDRYGAATDEDIIAMFKTWLDLLLIDITSFEDEHHTDGVPRLYDDGKIRYVKFSGARRATKRATVGYIVEQGVTIFNERGFTEGIDWWKEECKLIKSL